MIRVGCHKAPVAGRFWLIAALTAAGAIGAASQAEAARYFLWDPDPGYYRPGLTAPQQRQPRRHQAKKIEAPERESAKPQGPLIIAISIEKQRLKIFDANGFFAETPISTGMKGHPTPMGVFSVIQKHKLHHSNIYSGAPMPYMQRITWSGVAMHAGVLPGYPASHGCIRMPMAFAVKMWNWTKMGARVVVTPGEITPASFSHPLLIAQKVVPQPPAEPQVDAPAATKSDKASDAGATVKPAASEASLELRSTVGHDDGAKSAVDELSAARAPRDQTRTADASSDMPAAKTPITMTDASPSGGSAPPASRDTASAKPGDASNADTGSETAKSEAEPAAAKPAETVSSAATPVESTPSETGTAEIKPVEPSTTGVAGKKPDEIAAQDGGDAVQTDVTAAASVKFEVKASEKTFEAKMDGVKSDPPKPEAPGSAEATSEKAAESVKADSGTVVPDAKKDQARLPDTAKPAALKRDPSTAPKRSGQIAVFVSRKDSKLYVRQNFAPLFDVAVTIAPSDRPLGTHVFTAQIDKDDANLVRWSVVSLPVPVRYAERRDDNDRSSRRRKTAAAPVEAKPLPVPDSPTEALDRLSIPADALERIAEALSTGGSIIVSDQGIAAGETGEGTDFIVSLR
jgi:lipoprotein-anchoring transpeptidase ErfK/SrfK